MRCPHPALACLVGLAILAALAPTHATTSLGRRSLLQSETETLTGMPRWLGLEGGGISP
jgi:hypothetical protein